jgi:hypothetical protein
VSAVVTKVVAVLLVTHLVASSVGVRGTTNEEASA